MPFPFGFIVFIVFGFIVVLSCSEFCSKRARHSDLLSK